MKKLKPVRKPMKTIRLILNWLLLLSLPVWLGLFVLGVTLYDLYKGCGRIRSRLLTGEDWLLE